MISPYWSLHNGVPSIHWPCTQDFNLTSLQCRSHNFSCDLATLVTSRSVDLTYFQWPFDDLTPEEPPQSLQLHAMGSVAELHHPSPSGPSTPSGLKHYMTALPAPLSAGLPGSLTTAEVILPQNYAAAQNSIYVSDSRCCCLIFYFDTWWWWQNGLMGLAQKLWA